jgi:hypothetical protein
MENAMSRKPDESRQTKTAQADDKSHKPAKHIQETARLASSDESDKNPEKVRRRNKLMAAHV